MHFLKYYCNNNFQINLINRFNYKNVKKIPRLTKIVLSFGCNSTEFNKIAANLLAIELISNQKGKLTKSKKNNLLLKIRKGHPIGCKVTFRNQSMLNFLYKFNCEIITKIKNFQGFKRNCTKNTFTYHIANLFLFEKLEKQFQFFSAIKNLNINFVASSNNKNELIFLLQLLNLHFKQINRQV